MRRRPCCLHQRDFAHLCLSTCLLCLHVCVRACVCERPDRVSTAPGPTERVGLSRIYSFPHSCALTQTTPRLLWFPGSEAAAALIFSSKLYLSREVNGQKSRRVGSADHSEEAGVVERLIGPRPIDNTLSIVSIHWQQAGDKCAAFIWDEHKMLSSFWTF